MQPCRRRSSRRPEPAPLSSNNTASTDDDGIADNFQTFLTLLTTQLQHQNPMDPLDTNQFTQQLVQFAGIEQQLKSNEQLKSLVEIEKSAQATQALVYVGSNVAVDGSKAQFDKSATWNFHSDKRHQRDDHDHRIRRDRRPIPATFP
jgi:flagellar basal-body rod modification protein FlgD